ncbi:MAG: ABC transporter permease [Protaetiibacter sp.]
MSSVQEAAALAEVESAPMPRRRGRERAGRGGAGSWVIGIYSIVALVIMMIPIAYTIVFSFNEARRTNIVWRSFTFDNWLSVCDDPRVCESFGNSILVGVVATIAATTLGTMIAIAIVRYTFRMRTLITVLLFLPMATPEVVLGSGLGSQFVNMGVERGLWTIIVAHIMFCISFVVVTVRARVASLDPALEEAGRDLYASPGQVFWRVTLPLLMPGILAAALLCFALSFDDFIITNFVSGNAETFPKFVYVAASRGIPPQSNVIASAVFVLAIVIVVVAQVSAGFRRRKIAKSG